MILERITTSECPSQSPPSELSVNFLLQLDHNFSNVFRHGLKQLETNSASFTKVTLGEFSLIDTQVHSKQEIVLFILWFIFPPPVYDQRFAFPLYCSFYENNFQEKRSGKYFLNNLIPWIRFQKDRLSLSLGPDQPYMTFLISFVLWGI